MTTETEIQDVKETEIQDVQLSDFGIQPNRSEGFTTLTKDDATLKIASTSDVTVEDPRGVQVTRHKRNVPNNANIIYKDKNEQILTTRGATVEAPLDRPAAVKTSGKVFLANPDAPAASALAEGAVPETGTQLNITEGGLAGKIDGTKVDINGDNVLIDADVIEAKPSDEAITDAENDLQFSLTKTFNSLVVKGKNVDIRIDIVDGQSSVYVKGGEFDMMSVEDAKAGANDAAIQLNGDVVRFTLADGKIFDINTATGNLTAYLIPGTPGVPGEMVHNGGDPELADLAPIDAAYEIAISQDGSRVAMNGSSVEKTDGVFAAATDGVSHLTAVAIAAAAAAEAKAAADAEAARVKAIADEEAKIPEGFVAIVWPDGTPVLSPDTGNPMFVAKKDLEGTQTLEEADKAVEALQSQGVTNAHLAKVGEDNILTALFNQHALSRPKPGMSEDEIVSAQTRGEVDVAVPAARGEVKGFKRPGGLFSRRATKAAGHYWAGDKPTPENPIPYDINGAIIYRGDGHGIKGEKNPKNKHSTRIVLS